MRALLDGFGKERNAEANVYVRVKLEPIAVLIEGWKREMGNETQRSPKIVNLRLFDKKKQNSVYVSKQDDKGDLVK